MKALRFLTLAGILAGVTPFSARADTALDAARVCYSEAGLPGFTRAGPESTYRECAAVLTSLSARAAILDRPFRTHMHLYSGRVFDRSRTDGRRWLAFLTPSGPSEGFPRRASWGARAASWRSLQGFVRRWLAAPWNPCEGLPPEDWGVGARVIRRYRRSFPQAVRIECGLGPGRHNTFLRRYPNPNSTDPDYPHNEPYYSPQQRATENRISIRFRGRRTLICVRNLSDEDLDTLP